MQQSQEAAGLDRVWTQINGESSILRCYNGMALAKMNRHEDAVTQLREAIVADPHNPLARLELAAVLLSAHCLEEALQELQILQVPPPLLRPRGNGCPTNQLELVPPEDRNYLG